jgi:hypothetical protein
MAITLISITVAMETINLETINMETTKEATATIIQTLIIINLSRNSTGGTNLLNE